MLRGPLDMDALLAALNDLSARHESLRSTISADGMQMYIGADSNLPAEVHDLSTLDDATRQARLSQHRARAVEMPFDLVNGPLARATILKLGAQTHLLLLTAHH